MRLAALWCSLLFGCASPPNEPVCVPGHSHNDYLRRRPLLEALEAGVCSVEADVFLVDGEFRIGHEEWMLRADRMLESVYLDPLRARVRDRGCVLRPDDGFTLLIDIKTGGTATWPRLREVLARHREMLTRFRDDGITPGAVTVVLSGDSPRAEVARETERLCAIDGRPVDLDRNPPATLVPLISDDWNKHFEWDGFENMPDSERQRLIAMSTRAHAQGRRLRFWAAPDTVASWRTQREAGVDLVNTDRPVDLARELR